MQSNANRTYSNANQTKSEEELTMAEEITIKEMLERAGIDADSERYQELASYIAAHGVYAVDLTDNDSKSNANQTQTKRNQTQIVPFVPNSEEERKWLKEEEKKWSKPEFTWFQVPTSMCRSHLMTSDTRCHTQIERQLNSTIKPTLG